MMSLATKLLTCLPSELLLKICSHLSMQDLSSLSGTCATLYSHATDPTLWEHAFQVVPSDLINEDPELYINILNLRRFNRMRRVHIEISPSLGGQHISALFGSLVKKKYLEEVIFGESFLCAVPADILIGFLKKIVSVTFDFGTKISNAQLKALFKSIEDGNKIRSLYLEELNLKSIEPKTFATAVNKLTEFTSYYIVYKDEQVKTMFVEMARSTSLQKLVFHHRSVDYVDPEILAKAFNNLTDLTVNLSDLPFSNHQITEIFRQMSSKTKLKKLEILTYSYPDLWDFSFLSPNILAKAVKNLQEVYMTDIVFSNAQIDYMFEALARNDQNVVLDLGHCDISQVSLELLEEVVEKLEPNSFVRKLKFRILQLCEENVNRLKCRLNEVDSEHREVIEDILSIRKEGKMMRFAALKAKGFIFLPQSGVSRFYQKTKYSSRCSFLRYSRHLKHPTFWRTLKLKNHVRDCKEIRKRRIN